MRHTWLLPAAIAGAFGASAPLVHSIEYASVPAAQKTAFPEASTFEPFVAGKELRDAVARKAGRFTVEPRIWRVREGERTIGWFVIDEVVGKQELITYAVALDASGAVRSVDVLAYRESHGDAIRLPAWRNQFTGKRESDPLQLDRDIRNISGATLSCRHVTEGVHRILVLHADGLARG